MPAATLSNPSERLRLDLTGAVQGVGFRPFVFRLAGAEGLGGFVRNTGEGLTLEVEGAAPALRRFLARLDTELPPHAAIHKRQMLNVAPSGEAAFCVLPSSVGSAPSALVMPDLATCTDCLSEVFDPSDRRFGYPFTTCIHCGPRYSIIEALPYDRARTAMRHFPLCPACRAEYEDPASRRFHAEPIACPGCGPQLAVWDGAGKELAGREAALAAAVTALRQGLIVAVKGLGGFQLLVDAGNEVAVQRLRARKGRPRKPFPMMVPSLAAAERLAFVSAPEAVLLATPQAPIVLSRARPNAAIATAVAPGNPNFGLVLPYTPLHHLLLRAFDGPVIATSGNLSSEPIVVDEQEALARLGGVADLFLVHDRPILHAVDDSVVRVIAGRETVLRRARGLAPLPLSCPAVREPLLALGGQQKNAVATGFDGRLFLGPHIGDLAAPEARAACDRMAADLTALHCLEPARVACDTHPDYYTSHMAARRGLPVTRVPHHLAHILSGMIDNELEGPVLGIAWDGSGHGHDGTVWGGEFLAVREGYYRRFAHFLPFPLPGGETAVREPRRAAIGVLYAMFGAEAFDRTSLAPLAALTPQARGVLATMVQRGLNSPITSSVGRLFDAAASLLGLLQVASFEGEAAMAVEFAADRADNVAVLPPPVPIDGEDGFVVDWRPLLSALVESAAGGMAPEPLAAGLHDALAQAIVAVAERGDIAQVLLTGGCFQNARLTECAVRRLRIAGFSPYWHHRIPPNDGGLAAGQILFAAKPLLEEHN